MPKFFIKSITIEGFRGINNEGTPLVISLKEDGVTSFFGENGMGKSSIFEAFLFSILGRIIRFDDYHGDIKDKTSIKNLFHKGDGTIDIEFVDDSKNVYKFNVKVTSNGERIISSSSVPNPDSFLESLCSSQNFLDYKSFEKIILTSAEETGKLFSNLVGFGSFINIKDKLDKISRTQNINNDFGKTQKETDINKKELRIEELQSDILLKLKTLGHEFDSFIHADVLTCLKYFLKKQYSIKFKTITSASQVNFDELVKSKISTDYESNVSKLNKKLELQTELSLFKNSIAKFNKGKINKLSGLLNKSYKSISKEEIVLGRLYDESIKGYNILSEFDKNKCLLCETPDLGNSQNTFYNQIALKLDAYAKFKNSYQIFNNELLEIIQENRILDIEKRYLPLEEQFFKTLHTSKEVLENEHFDKKKIEAIVLLLKSKNTVKIKETKKLILELKKTIPPKISELVEINNYYKSIFHSLVEISKLENDNIYDRKFLAELENWIIYVNQVKKDYEDAYNILMDEIAYMIDTDTKAFFKEIMGNEQITPKLKKENRGQKVNILLEKFYTNSKDIKAAPILSESYRNALCLSIYFATALKSKSPGNFIIIDDITSSFDSGHQWFLLNLIKCKIAISPSNKRGKQIIFLTHDGLLKKILNENSNEKNWKHYSISSNSDIVSLKPITSDDLKNNLIAKIKKNEYEGSGLRIFYESILLEIIERLNLEIPFSLINNQDEKMIRNLTTAIFEIINLKVKAKKIEYRLLPTKADLNYYIQLCGNILSHRDSLVRASLSQPVLLRLVDDIDAFKRKFQYNCTCAKKAGIVYYIGLKKNPVQKGCSCKI